ncbi:MAG: phosphatidylglycerophosphatase A [gamma proteobacterium symbiont of Bathyaustriella thionipta]|nr:phosphatidylglycerophosphatase A [gamma proteobacterium symbiont of Bathyaustriella thionipta]
MNKVRPAHWSHWLATGFGSGLSPYAPGTMGSLLALVIFLPLSKLPLPWYAAVVSLICVTGIWICGKTAKDWGEHDHGAIVWDELGGQLIALTAMPLTPFNLIVAFILFRFFDILKPWPIRWADRKVSGGLGIMLDDILAGAFAWLVLMLLNRYVFG